MLNTRVIKIAVSHCTALSITLGLFAFPSVGLAWGPEGNRVICDIAERHLSPAALKVIDRLMAAEGASDLTDVNYLADVAERTNVEVSTWERTPIPIIAETYDETRDCPHGNCSVGRVEMYEAMLTSATATPTEKRGAFNWLVRLIADISDPALTTAAPSGSPIFVRGASASTTLAAYWSTALLAKDEADGHAVARRLDAQISAQDAAAWISGTAEDWAAESHAFGVQVLYGPQLGKVDRSTGVAFAEPSPEYLAVAHQTIELQLERAGVRLAGVLNAAFAD
jgi:hypothetical protein